MRTNVYFELNNIIHSQIKIIYSTDQPHQTIDDVSSEQFNALINVNLTGYFRFCKVK